VRLNLHDRQLTLDELVAADVDIIAADRTRRASRRCFSVRNGSPRSCAAVDIRNVSVPTPRAPACWSRAPAPLHGRGQRAADRLRSTSAAASAARPATIARAASRRSSSAGSWQAAPWA
jgi:hypothetical protein